MSTIPWILLESHVLFWWVNGDHHNLSLAALAGLEDRDQTLLVSAVSCLELAMLVQRVASA